MYMSHSSDLESIAQNYSLSNDFDEILLAYNMQTVKPYFKGDQFLELGCATGESTRDLLPFISSMHVVEGAQKNIDVTKEKIANMPGADVVTYEQAFWEDASYTDGAYSDIIWFRGFAHITQPDELLRKLGPALESGGRIHIVIPNAFSLHRRLGVYAGFLKDPHELNERDHRVGHVAVYDRFQLTQIITDAGFRVVAFHGVMLKPLPNSDMMKYQNERPELIDALFQAGKELPDYCAELYMCIELNK